MSRIILVVFIAVILVSSCGEPPVVFIEAQPQDLDAKAYFEPIYRGVFLCESDSATVYVKAKTIHKEKEYNFKTTLEEIDSIQGAELIGDQLWLEGFEEPVPVEIEGDSISGEILFRDTLFEIGKGQVLKFFRGHHILNKKLIDEKWEVLILSIDYDLNLRLYEAAMPEDLGKLDKVTPVKDISTEEIDQILLAPTVTEFRNIMRMHLVFQECDLYRRMKLPTEI